MNKLKDSHPIEFLGGPYDGHVEQMSVVPSQLPDELVWLVSAPTRKRNAKTRDEDQPVSSVAVYRREQRSNRWFYVFVGAMGPQQFWEQCVRAAP